MALLEDRLPSADLATMPPNAFSTREGAVKGLNWLISTLHDPYSQYLTKDQLLQELRASSDGFMGTGALVEAPQRALRQDMVATNHGEDSGPKTRRGLKTSSIYSSNEHMIAPS